MRAPPLDPPRTPLICGGSPISARLLREGACWLYDLGRSGEGPDLLK
jgi:hypothetical protein